MGSFKQSFYIMIALLSLLFPLSAWSGPVKLNGPLVSGGGDISSHRISADSSWVVYRADQETDEVYELYSVPIGGGTAVRLNPPLVSGREVWPLIFSISADSSWVVYSADQDAYTVYELYSVRLNFSPQEPFLWELFLPAFIKKK